MRKKTRGGSRKMKDRVAVNRIREGFFALLRAGLWEHENVLSLDAEDYKDILRLSEAQCVQGLIAAGIEQTVDINIPQEEKLQLVGIALQIEQKNRALNRFIAELVIKLRSAGVYTLLVKGQGVAQCYTRPLWRLSGDVDFFLSDDNYLRAKECVQPLAARIDREEKYKKHLGMAIGEWEVELHGSLRCGFLHRVDKVLDEIQNNTFYDGNVRSWDNDGVQIFMLGCENDVLYVFAHCLNHFFKDGVGLRQVCDWIRLLWILRDKLDVKLLDSRLCQMGMKTEWKTFAALAVNTLGMPQEAMPFYDPSPRWEKNASKVLDFIMKTGNMGHNRDMSYMQTKPFVARKIISLWRHTSDGVRYFTIFPLDSVRVWSTKVKKGLISVVRGK